MASTLTDTGELLYASFPIDKTETTADGDIVVYGKASDGSIDADQQIVDPTWMGKAVQEWLATGPNLRVQHQAQRDPAGIGLTASTDAAGATWVKSLVVEPVAQKLVSKGVLRAYSVGIARPTIERDMAAKGGRITGGVLVELSLVDRPANKSCGIQLVKSVDGNLEYTQEMFGDQEVISKMLNMDIEKSISGDISEFTLPPQVDMSITFTPQDLAKILQNKFVEKHYDELALQALYAAEAEVYKRDVSTAERRSLASSGSALADGSYPIANAGDLGNAAHLAATGHGNAEGAKRLIARRAKELGVANPLDSDESKTERGSVVDATAELTKSDDVTEPVVKEAEPEVTKDPEDEDTEKASKPKKGGKKMPPWLNKPDDDDSKGGDDSDDSSSKSDEVEKCSPSGTPQSASGAKDAAPMNEIPNTGPALETPMPAGRKGVTAETSALLRFKTIGIDSDLGKLHDLTCPAFHPDEVAKYHPFADLDNVIDLDVWQRKAVDSACGPLDIAMAMTKVWDAAQTLKSADMADLNDYRIETHKAFRDANPGVSSYPSPGSISPSSYHRGVITAGQATLSPGYDGPNSAPSVASGTPNASHFDRPPLSSMQERQSPSFMKNDHEYPGEQGVPMRINYAHAEKEKARWALDLMHDNLSRMFPPLCPVQATPQQPESRPLPPTAGLGKAVEPETQEELISKAPADVPQDVIDAIEKGMRKKLGKKVLSGAITVDEARSKMGRKRAQKMLEWQTEQQLAKGEITREDALKALGFPSDAEVTIKSTGPEVIKSPVGNAPAPSFPAQVSPDMIKSAVAEALAPLMETITLQKSRLDDQQKMLDAIADSPDPKTQPWTGLALKSARPAGVVKQAEIAERTQQMIQRQLHHTWRSSENPMEREAAWKELTEKYGFTE